MLNCSDVKKTYFNKTAVENISLSLENGKIYALLGPNGSGKTTFMKMIAGLVKPTSGTILYENEPIGVQSKREIAYLPTESFFYSFMTVKDVGIYYRDFFEDFDMEKYAKLIADMDLRMEDKASKLSSGMAAKLKIAATLARAAKLYLLDEPLNGIDIIARENPIKFEPVSPINVFAGLKLNGKKPTIAPANAVIKTIAIKGEPLSAKTISNDKHEIKVTPEDNPSSPSIKFIALVIPTIQHTVRIYEKISFTTIFPSVKGIDIFSICTPKATTIIAATI